MPFKTCPHHKLKVSGNKDELVARVYNFLRLSAGARPLQRGWRRAVARMHAAGAVPCTYKMLFYELLQTNDPAAWREQQQRAVTRGFVPPESLPPLC